MTDYFAHDAALVDAGAQVGARTRVWAFAHLCDGAVIGEDCNVCDHTFVEGGVTVGDRVTIKSGVYLWEGTVVGDDVFIGPSVVFTNDRYPRSRQRPAAFDGAALEARCSVGAGAVLLPGITIGEEAMVGAGAVVVHDVPPRAVVVGNPGRVVGYVDSVVRPAPFAAADPMASTELPGGASIIRLPVVDGGRRGLLSFAEVGQQLPFVPRRVFMVYGVRDSSVRGEHAHKTLHEVLICIAGSCRIVLDDGRGVRQEIVLDSPSVALHVPPRTWRAHYGYSPDAVLVVLASDTYDAADYIRDLSEFRAWVARSFS